MRCSVTKFKAVVSGPNLPKFNCLRFDITPTVNGSFHINQSDYSLLRSSNSYAKLEIVGENAVFSNGTKKATMSEAPTVTFTTGGTFTLFVEDYSSITKLFVPNTARSYKVKTDLNQLKYSSLTHLNLYVDSSTSDLLDIDLDFQNIPDSVKDLQIRYGGVTGSIAGKNLKNLTNFLVPISIEPFTVAELSALLDDGTGNSVIDDWGQIINNYNIPIRGDVMDISKNVKYVNLPYNSPLSCTLGKRNTSDCAILSSGSNNSRLLTSTDIDNFFINNAGCTLMGSHTDIKLKNAAGAYTPSADAQTAIATLKQNGITVIKVNDVDL